MKKVILKILVIICIGFIPVQSGKAGIVDLAVGVAEKLKQAADALRVASSLAAISDYPKQYKEAVNAIIEDLNEIKRLCAQSNLSKADQKVVLDVTAGCLNSISASLDEFNDIVGLVKVVDIGGEGSGNINKQIDEVREKHAENMKKLYLSRRITGQLKSLMIATHAGNSLIDQMNAARKQGY